MFMDLQSPAKQRGDRSRAAVLEEPSHKALLRRPDGIAPPVVLTIQGSEDPCGLQDKTENTGCDSPADKHELPWEPRDLKVDPALRLLRGLRALPRRFAGLGPNQWSGGRGFMHPEAFLFF